MSDQPWTPPTGADWTEPDLQGYKPDMTEAECTRQVKIRYPVCVFSGVPYGDDAHVFPRSTHPQLSTDVFNRVRIERRHHSTLGACFDKYADGTYRDIGEKIYMLQNWTLPEIRQKVKRQIELLRLSCEYHRIQWPEIKEPKDADALRYQGRLH